VSFTPGSATVPEPLGATSLRLSFALVEPGACDEGLRRLARALRAVRRRGSPPLAAPLS
jgi:DNA-binding transcriptional MocR family regulator